MNRRIEIWHHNDTDGFSAAAAFELYRPLDIKPTYKAVDYTLPLPSLDFTNTNLYILDFSVDQEVIDEIKSRGNWVYILDHHKSALEKLGADNPDCYFDMNRSGAMIAHDFFRNMYRPRIGDFSHIGIESPYKDFFDYVQDQDLGRYSLPESKTVKAFLYSIPRTIEDHVDAAYLTADVMMSKGNMIKRYIDTSVETTMEYAHIIQIDEYKALMINSAVMFDDISAELKKRVKDQGLDFCGCYFVCSNDMVKFSLRSKEDFTTDVDVVAKRFGGGGHRFAAGFEVKKEMFNLREIKSIKL